MSKKLKPARDLKKLPENRRHPAIIADITNEGQTDRAVAIIGAAYVDLTLREAVTSRLVRRDDRLMHVLFEDRGPLESFGSRIHLGYALGIYADGVFQDLKAIKDIRNAFAHAAEEISFATEGIGEPARSLNLRKIQYQHRPKPLSARECFVHSVEMIADCLIHDVVRRASGRSGESILQIVGRQATG